MALVFIIVVVAILLYLVVDGLITGEVWVRGSRAGFSLSQWAHKRGKVDEPFSYWFFMSLYTIGAVGVVLIYLLK